MGMADIIDKRKFLIVGLFLLSNRLQVLGDRFLAMYELTTRQWLLTLAIAQFGNSSPTLSEVAELMNSSHQNISRIAASLEHKGFIIIEKDKNDLRVNRLKLAEKTCLFWERSENRIRNMLGELFRELSQEDISLLYDSINKLYRKIINDEGK